MCAACDVTLADGLSEPEARALSATLNREGIAVSTEREGYAAPRYQLAIAPGAVPRAVSALRAVSPEVRAREPAQPLIPTPDSEQRARERELQARLTRALLQLPGVRQAAVEVSLAAASSGLSDLLRPAVQRTASAHISLVRDRQVALDQAHVRQLAASVVPGLTPAAVSLVEQAEAVGCKPCAELSHLGDVTLTRASLGTLKLWLGASLLLHMASAVALLVLLSRRRGRKP